MQSRHDLTRNLIHLTRGDTEVAAFNTLLTILREQRLLGGTGFIKGGYKCVCFSEAPLSVLASLMEIRHATSVRYQPIGISVPKDFVFTRGGRPVIYQPQEEFERLPEGMRYRHVSYDPCRKPVPVDVSWEREWRIRCDELHFEPAEVTVILPNRDLADQLSNRHEQAYKAELAAGRTPSRVMPWHVVVLEDLGVSVEFPKLNIVDMSRDLSIGTTTTGSLSPPMKAVESSVSANAADIAWLPSGRLSDGTLLLGPLKERPSNLGRVFEIGIDGVPWFVAHSGDEIAVGVRLELESWARKRLTEFEKKKAS